MSKQTVPYLVKLIRNVDGERLPCLIERETGLPDFDATLWVVSSLRNRNLASETISQALRSLIVLYLALRLCKVNLSSRLGTGNLLSPAEIEAISKACRVTILTSAKALSKRDELKDQRTKKVTSLEKLRMPQVRRKKEEEVSAGTTSIRLAYIRAFLKWRVNKAIARTVGQAKATLIALRDLIDQELENKTPSVTERATIGQRMGIERPLQVQLLSVVTPTNAQNPWCGERIRLRNQFIINAFLALGIRRGELAGMRVGDFNPQEREVRVLRRPDDKNDPRLHEPNSKTRDRVLPVSYELYALLKKYLMVRHDLVRGRHDFLLVANTGEPISKSEVNRIFDGLKQLFGNKMSPHVLRHTYFENLADDLHRAGQNDVQILSTLRQLGGWSEKSDSPRRYTKRFTQGQASKAGLELQAKLYPPNCPAMMP